MKYLITESQVNKFIDRMIQETIQELRDECVDYDEDQEPGDWYNWDDCDAVDILEELVVNDIETLDPHKGLPNNLGNYAHSNGKVYPTFNVWVSVYYYSLRSNIGYDWDEMAYLLKRRIFQKYKIILLIRMREWTNTNTNIQW